MNFALWVVCAMLALPVAAEELSLAKSAMVGGHVEVTQPVQGSYHAAGGRVTVNAPISGSARIAGGRIQLGANAAIAEDASLAGGSVEVNGPIKGDLHAVGGRIAIDSSVAGDASIAGGTLELGPNARIGGSLKFRGGDLIRDPGAQVAGTIERLDGGYRRHHDYGPFGRFTRGWVWTLGLMVLAAIVAGALPGPMNRMSQELREHPWMSALLGFVALTCIPVAAALVMLTIIGIPIGVLAILAYAALLLVGYVCVSVVVGGLLLDRFKADRASVTAWRVGAAVLVMLVLGLLGRLPFVGGAVALIALVVGVGMIFATYARKPAPVNPT